MGMVALLTMKGSQAPEADTTLISQLLPSSGDMPRTATLLAGALPVFLLKDIVLAHCTNQTQAQPHTRHGGVGAVRWGMV